jgi:hypothetical protein
MELLNFNRLIYLLSIVKLIQESNIGSEAYLPNGDVRPFTTIGKGG